MDHTLGLIYLLENLGFIVHPEKTLTSPHPGNRIPRDVGQLALNGVVRSGAETEEDPPRGCQDARPVSPLLERYLVCWGG